jgi:Lhr-like helicase
MDEPMTTFAELGLSPKILKALEKTTLKTPTPIQAQAIPHIMQGRDLMGLAQTGTGKTAAFGLPLLHRMLDIGHPPGPKNVRALILAPTRELIGQIKDNLRGLHQGHRRQGDHGRRRRVPLQAGASAVEGHRRAGGHPRPPDRPAGTRRRQAWRNAAIWCWTRPTTCWTWASSIPCARSPSTSR